MLVIQNLHDFINALPTAIHEAMVAQCSLRKLQKEETLYRRGDYSDELYQLVSGAVRLCNVTTEGQEVVLGEFRPGDSFGEMGLLDGLPRQSNAVASQPADVRVLSKTHFEQLLDDYPQISRQLNVMLSRRVRLLFEMVEDASVLSLRQRVARVIHRLAYSHGTTPPADGCQIELSQEELARMLGVSRQSVSKELQHLKQGNCIAIQYGRLYITDFAALSRLAETLPGSEQIGPGQKLASLEQTTKL